MKVPEFEVFKRIESLEEKIKGEFTVKDASILALVGFELAFTALGLHTPQYARKFKDEFLGKLKKMDVTKKWLDCLEEDCLNICELVEQLRK